MSHFRSFLSKRCIDRKEEMQLVVYLVYSVMIIFGMPLHFGFGLIGQEGFLLRTISFVEWLCCFVFLALYLSGRMHLKTTFFWLSVCLQFAVGLSIVLIAVMARPENMIYSQKMLTVNGILSLFNILIVCMGLVPNASTVIMALFTLFTGVAYVICPQIMLSQFVLLFFYSMLGVWGYSLLMHHLFRSTSREISDYKMFQDGVLNMFHMSKAEAITLIRLSREAGRVDGIDDQVLENLSERTRNNLIALGEHLQNERRDKMVDLSTIFPQLSPSELEVARLILKNMPLKEIAVATGKSLSNVGTVRGNIRKKLGLGPDDDLRNYLLSIVPSQTNY
ncbi:MAG: helix-turn-helix transcriptional regulator [Prevotella sp.]